MKFIWRRCARTFSAQLPWGVQDPALVMQCFALRIAKLLGVNDAQSLDCKHFVPEGAAKEIAEAIATLARSVA